MKENVNHKFILIFVLLLEDLKLKVASQCENDIDRYCAGKNDFIQMHEKLAIEWKKQTSEPDVAHNSGGFAPSA